MDSENQASNYSHDDDASPSEGLHATGRAVKPLQADDLALEALQLQHQQKVLKEQYGRAFTSTFSLLLAFRIRRDKLALLYRRIEAFQAGADERLLAQLSALQEQCDAQLESLRARLQLQRQAAQARLDAELYAIDAEERAALFELQADHVRQQRAVASDAAGKERSPLAFSVPAPHYRIRLEQKEIDDDWAAIAPSSNPSATSAVMVNE